MGDFYIGENDMRVMVSRTNQVIVSFDGKEIEFLAKEADKHGITVKELLEMVLSMLFIMGYSKLTGKES